MKHVSDLIVKGGDTRDFSGITEVTGNVVAYDRAKLDLPACTSVTGYVMAYDGSKLDLPACTSIGKDVEVYDRVKLDLPACTSVGGYVMAYGGSKIDLPACTNINGESFHLGSLRMVDVGPWAAILTPGYLSIGCQHRTWDEWLAMSDSEIAVLDKRAAEVATKFRAAILKAKGE